MSKIAEDSPTTVDIIQKRNISGELDVFEAKQYFSDYNNEQTTVEYSRIQIQKQSNIITETRQNRVHPQTEDHLPKPRAVVVVKRQEVTRGGGAKLASFLKSLFRSASSNKSRLKLKSTPEVETPRVEKMRRKSCVVVTTSNEASSPIASTWRLNARRRSFDVNDSKRSDPKLDIKFYESLKKVECKGRNGGDESDVNGGYESDSSSESDLFELDLFAKSKP